MRYNAVLCLLLMCVADLAALRGHTLTQASATVAALVVAASSILGMWAKARK